MKIFQALGSQGAIVVGFVSTAAEILVAFVFLRTFKIIRRREYARLKRSEAEHQRCRAEWDPIFTLRLVTRRWPRVLRPKNLEYKSHPSARILAGSKVQKRIRLIPEERGSRHQATENSASHRGVGQAVNQVSWRYTAEDLLDPTQSAFESVRPK